MSISIGDINLANEIVELNFQLRKTQNLLQMVINKSPVIGGIVNQSDIIAAETEALDYVKKRFPNMGIERK